MKMDHCGSYSTMLKLSDVGEEATEEYLRHALDNAMLKGSRVVGFEARHRRLLGGDRKANK